MKKLLAVISLLLIILATSCGSDNDGFPSTITFDRAGESHFISENGKTHPFYMQSLRSGDTHLLIDYYVDREIERDTTVHDNGEVIITVGADKAFPCEFQWITIDKVNGGYNVRAAANTTGKRRKIEIISETFKWPVIIDLVQK